jgi:hypothetical protein
MPALSGEEHRQIRRLQKAQRNEGRRRRRANPTVVSWMSDQARRCVLCGKWIALGAEAGHGLGFRVCEPCWLAVELRREAALGGPAQPREDQHDGGDAQDDHGDADPADGGHPAMVPPGGRRAA